MYRARNANSPPVKNSSGTPTQPVTTQGEILSQSTSDRPQITGDPGDYEPDETWKDEVTKRIDAAFESMLNDSKKTRGGRFKEEEMGQPMGLRKGGIGRSLRFEEEWKQAIATIVALKKREYDYELEEERGSRRSATRELKPPVVEHRTATSYGIAKRDAPDYEPDDQWKAELKNVIDRVFESMVNDAKEDQAAMLRNASGTQKDRLRIEDEFKECMATIKGLKKEQYDFELAKERSARRWKVDVPLDPVMFQMLKDEQASIMNTIRNTPSSEEMANGSPADERSPDTPTTAGISPKPLQQQQLPAVPLKGFRDNPTLTEGKQEPPQSPNFHSTKTRSKSPKQRVTVEDVPDDESIQSYLPDDGPILDLRTKGMDHQDDVIRRQGPTQTAHVGLDHDHSPRTEPRVDAPKAKTGIRKVTEAEIRFGNRKIPELNNVYGQWTPPVPAGSPQVGVAGPGKASQNRMRREFG